jgi:phosphate transport system substrate-binding protein
MLPFLVQKLGEKLANIEHDQLVQEVAHYSQPFTPKGTALSFDGITYPHVDGSTSTRPLARLMACRLLNSPAHWVLTPAYPTMVYSPISISYDTLEFRFANRDLEAITEPRENFRLGSMINDLIVRHHGTHRAYENLIRKKSDFILVARLPSEDELKEAEGQKVQLDVRPVARDAFVFLVNNLNPIDNLSSTQIRQIYAGQLKNWKSVGGPSAPISAYQRGRNSGSQELMLSLVMKHTPMVSGGNEWKQRMIGSGMGGPFHRLINDENGLGYSVHYYEHFMASSPFTKVIAVDGVHPSRESIANQSYPYITQVYAAIRHDLPSDHNARQLLDWLLTEEGQAVVAESGYVPIHDAVRLAE